MSKYRPLSDRLSGHADDEWRATFADIEQMLGFSLPKGARSGRAWWERAAPDGWEVGDVSQGASAVTFRRKPAKTALADPIQPRAMVAASEKASGLAARQRKLGAAAIAAGVAAVGVGVGMAIIKLAPRPTLAQRVRSRFR